MKEEQTDAAPFKISIYLPTGYIANLGQSAGVQIGTVDAGLQALLVSTDVISAPGTVVVGDKTSPALQASATQCTGAATHAAIWLLHVVAGQTLDVPLFVDPTTAADPPSTSAKLVLCLPNPYADAQPPSSRAPAGAKIIDAKLTLSAGVLTNPTTAGTYLWRSVITPWTANGSAAERRGDDRDAGNRDDPVVALAEGEAEDRAGQRTRVTNSVLLSGKVLESLTGISGAKVAFFANGKSSGAAMTGASGRVLEEVGAHEARRRSRRRRPCPTRETACVTPLPASSFPRRLRHARPSPATRSPATPVTVTPTKR